MGYVVSFTACLQEPQCNLQAQKEPQHLTAISAECSTQEPHTS